MVNVCVVFIKPGELEDVDLGDLLIESEISSVSLNISSAGKMKGTKVHNPHAILSAEICF